MAKRTRTGPTFIQRSREPSPQAKAVYHDQTGAGRARVKRPFLRLSVSEVFDLVRHLESRVGPRVARL